MDMNEKQKTLMYLGVAAVLVAVAFLVTPSRIVPEAFSDQGQKFFPTFKDPNDAKTLEVIEYDEQSGAPRPFKVTFENDRWTIPSHHNYPADAKDRLAKTAAGVIDIRKDEFRSDNPIDQAECGVVDPLDETAGLTGRGTRVTIKGADQNVLADIIFGKPVEGRKDFRFVRLPDEKRIYAAKVDVDLSTRFQDWIETDLLKVSKARINRVEIQDYSINERTGSLDRHDDITLSKKDNKWSTKKMPSGKVVDSARVDTMLTTLEKLEIVGVRPKPEGLSASLQKSEGKATISADDARSLQSKGFYFTRDGALVSNEGELSAQTVDGVQYTLRFGEVVSGQGGEGDAGGSNAKTGPKENRYLFVTADFLPELFPEPKSPANLDFKGKADSLLTDADRKNKKLYDAHERWKQKVTTGKSKADELNQRFADWYYVISSDSFDKLRHKRSQLVVSKKDTSS